MYLKLNLLVLLFLFSLRTALSQPVDTGNGESGSSVGKTETTFNLTDELVNNSVDPFSGLWNTSIDLGSVSTVSGINFNLQLSYSSQVKVGSTQKHLGGLPYGDNWNLNIPMLSVQTEDYHKFTVDEMACANEDYSGLLPPTGCPASSPSFDNDANCTDALEEGRIYWFAPTVSVPGYSSTRLVYTGEYSSSTGFKFLPYQFEKYLEAHLKVTSYGYPFWEVTTHDGTIYTYEVQSVNHRLPSNQRVQSSCFDNTNVKDILANLYLPKTEFLHWYCTKIEHPNKPDAITFVYEKYGELDKFPQFTTGNTPCRINQYFFEYSQNVSKSGIEKTYERILLKEIHSPTERVVLTYDHLDNSLLPAGSNILHPSQVGTIMLDNFYAKQYVTGWSYFDSWWRYFHGISKSFMTCETSLNPTNPYIATNPTYPHPTVKRENSTPLGKLQTKMGSNFGFDYYDSYYLESPTIDFSTLVFGDYYDLEVVFNDVSNPSLMDFNIVTGDQNIWNGANVGGSEEYFASCYQYGFSQSITSSFSSPLKYVVNKNDNPNATTAVNFQFSLPSMSTSLMNGMRLQIGASNSDSYHDIDLCAQGLDFAWETYFNHPGNLSGGMQFTESASTPNNFGIGAPWFIMNDYYSDIDINLFADINNPTPICTLDEFGVYHCNSNTQNRWHKRVVDLDCGVTMGCYHESKPLMTDPNIEVKSVGLTRIGEMPYMLSTVTKQKRNTSSQWTEQSNLGMDYTINTIKNTAYYEVQFRDSDESLNAKNSQEEGDRYLVNLSKVKLLKNEPNQTFSNNSTGNLTYHFGYETKKYSVVDPNVRKNFHCAYMVLNAVTSPYGLEKNIAYSHPDFSVLRPHLQGNFDETLISQIASGESTYSYIVPDYFHKKRWTSRIPTGGLDPMCYMTNEDNKIRISSGLGFTIHMVVESTSYEDSNSINTTDYTYSNLASQITYYNLADNFLWGSSKPFALKYGYENVTKTLPTFDGIRPYTKYMFNNGSQDQGLYFGKPINIKSYDGNNNLISEVENTYSSLKVFAADWMNNPPNSHPDFILFNTLDNYSIYDVPRFFETRFTLEMDNISSFFVKLTSSTTTNHIGSENYSITTDYKYFDGYQENTQGSLSYNYSSISGLQELHGGALISELPSFNLYSQKVSSSDFSSVNSETENFYLFDVGILTNSTSVLGNKAVSSVDRSAIFQTRHKSARGTEKHIQSEFTDYQEFRLLPIGHYTQVEPAMLLGVVNEEASIAPNCLQTTSIDLYNVENQVLESSNVRAEKTVHTYFPNGQLESTTTSNSSDTTLPSLITSYTYTPVSSLPFEITDPNGVITRYSYDRFGRKSLEYLAGRWTRSYFYHNWDNIYFDTYSPEPSCGSNDPWSYYTNQNYIRVKEFNADTNNSTTKTFYTPKGETAFILKETDNRIETNIYDPYGRVIEQPKLENCEYYTGTFTENASSINYEYSAYPQNFLEKRANFGWSITGVRTVDITTSVVNASDVNTAISNAGYASTYILAGKYIEQKTEDEDNKYQITYSDIFGNQVASITGSGNGATVFKLDARGNVLISTNPENQKTTYTYNYLNQLATRFHVDAGLESYGYDIAGNMIYKKSVERENLYQYDGYNRLVKRGKSISSPDLLANDGNAWIGTTESYFDIQAEVSAAIDTMYVAYFYDAPDATIAIPSSLNTTLATYTNRKNRLIQTISYKEDIPFESVLYGYGNYGDIVWQGNFMDFTDLRTPSDGVVYDIQYLNTRNGITIKESVDMNDDGTIDYSLNTPLDNQHRIDRVEIEVGGSTSSPQKYTQYEYDDLIRLTDKVRLYHVDDWNSAMCADAEIDVINYTYNSRFRLKGLNSHLFTETLYYDASDIPNIEEDKNYNGNINGISTFYNINNSINVPTTEWTVQSRKQGFKYDNYNRLLEVDSKLITSSGIALSYGNIGEAIFSYDKIGNMQNLNRKCFDPEELEVLTEAIGYNYLSGNNKLDDITYTLNGVGSSFTSPTSMNINYDGNGAMTQNAFNKLTDTYYTRENLSAYSKTNKIKAYYHYDANDNRVIKEVYDLATNDIQSKEYCIMDNMGRTIGVYHYGEGVNEWYVYGNTRLGSLTLVDPCNEYENLHISGREPTDKTYHAPEIHSTRIVDPANDISYKAKDRVCLEGDFEVPVGQEFLATIEDYNCSTLPRTLRANYLITDHLGSTRVDYHVQCNGSEYDYVIDNMIDYLPYGKELYHFQNVESERFIYTDKERDRETGLDYFIARNYNSDLCVFTAPDPLQNEFPEWSSYTMAVRNPINIIDPDGRDTLNINRGPLNTELSDDYTNVWNVTFSITVDGVTTPLSLEDGTAEIYMFGNKALDELGDNKLNEDVYTLKFEGMPSNQDLENTIRVGGDGFGVFIHAGNDFSKFSGCKGVCRTYNPNGTDVWGNGERQFYGNATQPTLDLIRGLYDKHESNLSGERFLLKTNSITPSNSGNKKANENQY